MTKYLGKASDIHAFDVSIAKHCGLPAAVVFFHILYWLKINARKRDVELVDGKVWMYESQKQISEFLGYLSEDEVFKAIKKLIECGLLEKGNHNKNPFDRTCWYTVTDQSLIQDKFTIPSNDGMQSVKRRNQIPSNDGMYKEQEDKQKENQYEQQQQQGASPPAPPAAAVSKIHNSGDIKYRTPGGIEKSISQNEVYSYFLKKPYKTETIKEAIEIVKQKNEPIGNILKLLEVICLGISNVVTPKKIDKNILPSTNVPVCTAPAAKITPWNNKEKPKENP